MILSNYPNPNVVESSIKVLKHLEKKNWMGLKIWIKLLELLDDDRVSYTGLLDGLVQVCQLFRREPHC